jgi:integrin alpha FG-GAP repeat containing protein 1
MADSGQGIIPVEQGMRTSTQCQIPQTSHRIMHNPFVLFGLSRSPNFVEELHFGAPRLPSSGLNQHAFIRQIVPNARVIVIPPALGDKNGNWQTRFYVTPSRLIILSMYNFFWQYTVFYILK